MNWQKKWFWSRCRLALLAISVFPLLNSRSRGALTWDNAGPNNNWSTADANWLPGPVGWQPGEDAIFGATVETVTVTTANLSVDDITFGASWTIANGAGSFSLADSNSDITVTSSSHTATISETFSGAGSITKLGNGTLTLSTSNAGLTGNLIVSAGILKGTAGTAFGQASNTRTITISSGATLDIGVSGMFGGAGSTAVPTLDIDGGTVTNSGSQNNPLNNVTLDGGTLTATVDNGITWRSWNINGIITSTGTSLISPGTAPNPGIRLKSTGGTTTMAVQSGTLTISAPVFNGRGGTNPFPENLTGIAKTGDGTLLLSGVNGYTGTTTVSDGILLANTAVSGTNSATGTGNVSVSGGATLGGVGQIRPGTGNRITVNANGLLAPGSTGIGTLTVDGGGTAVNVLTMDLNSEFAFQLGTAGISFAAPGTSDLLSLTSAAAGDLAFNGNNIDFLLTGAIGFYKLFDSDLATATEANDAWTGLTLGGVSGRVITSGLTVANLSSGLTGTLYLGNGTSIGDAGDIYLQVSAVPEPSSFAMLLFGSVLLWLVGRKRAIG